MRGRGDNRKKQEKSDLKKQAKRCNDLWKKEREFNMTFTNSKRQNKMIKMTEGRFRSDLVFFRCWMMSRRDENRN